MTFESRLFWYLYPYSHSLLVFVPLLMLHRAYELSAPYWCTESLCFLFTVCSARSSVGGRLLGVCQMISFCPNDLSVNDECCVLRRF